MTNDVWRKSSYSGMNNECVELSVRLELTSVRDSKNPEPTLRIEHTAWSVFLAAVRA
jgi:hypothetical protein